MAVAADGDVDDVVALRIERLEHRAGGGEGDVVLARAAAREQRDAEPAAHGVVVVVVVSVCVGVAPDGQVHDASSAPPARRRPGSCASTVPTWFGSDTSCSVTCHLKPDAWSCCCAEARS